MKSLIEDLLTLERVESERQASWAEVDFSVMVTDATEAQQSAAQLKHHTLSLTAENETLYVFGSSTQLRQSVANLISNAVKYTPDHGQIQVRLSQKEKRLIFEVQDNGYGISKERQQRLFHRFYRAHEPGTDHISGTGLGLSLVKTVIERHGGEVWVHSEPGIGSTFGFWLPLSTALRPPVNGDKGA
jgi:two-component system phosphate regulon sensor histidine kinase PhoR